MLGGPDARFADLRGGLIVPAEALQLVLDLQARGFRLAPNGSDIVVTPFSRGVGQVLIPSDPSRSPTITAGATGVGVILGTAAYMSPEQASGRAVDRRADLWAFGAVVYEMLTGRTPFPGADVTETLATILKSDPNWAALPPETPPAVRRLLRRALAKDPQRRLGDAGSALLELRDAQDTAGTDDLTPVARAAAAPGWLLRVFIGMVVLAVVGILAGMTARRMRPPVAPSVLRVTLSTDATEPLAIAVTSPDVAIAPDGQRVAYITSEGLTRRLQIRSLDQFSPAAVVSRAAVLTVLLSGRHVDRIL